MSSTTAPEAKPAFATSYEETSAYQQDETRDLASKKSGTTRLVESARLGLTLLALLSSITILGTAGDTLMVYNTTTLAGAFGISLWPSSFDLRPTVALVVCGALVTLFSAVSLAASKIPSVCSCFNICMLETRLTTATDSSTSPGSQSRRLRLPSSQPYRRSRRHLLLLWCQHLLHRLHTASLDMPMVFGQHGCQASLGHAVQGEQGRSISDGDVGTSRVVGTEQCGGRQVERKEGVCCAREKGKQKPHQFVKGYCKIMMSCGGQLI